MKGRLDRLESLRGFAAIYVVVGHICNVHFENGKVLGVSGAYFLPFRFAAEAVILFFLLSGFVIRYSTKDEVSFAEYFFKRFRRIYPLFFLSLGYSYVLSSYAYNGWRPVDVPQLLGNVFLLQDFAFRRPGVWFNEFYNDALWSLSYEWWFYMLFFPLMKWRTSPRNKNLAVYAFSLACVVLNLFLPNQLCWFGAYFVVWWTGAEMAREYRETGQVTLFRQWPGVVCMGAIAAVWLYPLKMLPRSQWAFGLYPLIDIRRLAGAAAMVVIGTQWRRLKWPLFNWTFGPFKLLAPISYGIYALHFPIIIALNNTVLAKYHVAYVIACFVLLIIVAYLGEIVIQGWINRATEPWLERIKRRGKRVRVASSQ